MNYRAFLDGRPLDVLASTVFPAPYNETKKAEFVIVTGSGPHDLRLTSEKEVRSAVIRPLSLGLTPELRADGIHIALDAPANFSVEINGGYADALLVFYAPAREEGVADGDPNVLYFPKGVHTPSVIDISTDDTVMYLEEGALVNAKLTVHDCRGFRLCGRGVLTSELYDCVETHNRCVDVISCQDVTIRDVTLADSLKWSCRIFGCDRVHIDNLKIIGWRGNSDGVDVCGSRNVLVERCFTRTWDDSLVVKAFNTGDLENVTFRDCVLWNDFARPIEVGVELRADHVKNVLFDNIDVIHSPTGYPVMGIHHGDRALVSDITFRNIRVEDVPGAQLFDIRITDSVWNTDNRKGRIENIAFENISLIGRPGIDYLPEKSRLQGFSPDCDIRGVSFKNISWLGKSVTCAEEANLLVMDYVSGVTFEADPALPPVGHVKTSVETVEPFVCGEDGLYCGRLRVRALNDGSAAAQCSLWLAVSPVHTAVFDEERKPISLRPGEEASFDYAVRLPAGRYVFRVQADDPCVDSAWELTTLDWRLGEKPVEYGFVNYYGDRLLRLRASVRDDQLILTPLSDRTEPVSLTVYSAMPADEYEGEVKFTVEETDFGEAPAVLLGRHGLELAPQLRCPAEITYVFKNEPRVREIRQNTVSVAPGQACALSFAQLGLDPASRHFWLEIEARLPETEKYRYPYTLFHSVRPAQIAHMFAHVDVI